MADIKTHFRIHGVAVQFECSETELEKKGLTFIRSNEGTTITAGRDNVSTTFYFALPTINILHGQNLKANRIWLFAKFDADPKGHHVVFTNVSVKYGTQGATDLDVAAQPVQSLVVWDKTLPHTFEIGQAVIVSATAHFHTKGSKLTFIETGMGALDIVK